MNQVNKVMDRALIAASVLFLFAYGTPIVNPNIDSDVLHGLDYIQLAVWSLFTVELVFRLITVENRLKFLRQHWLDVLAVVLPVLRPLRLLRLISTATLMSRRLGASASRRVAASVRLAFTSALLWLIAGLAVTDAERGQGGPIADVFDGWWWALTTMTTVGYGDFYPVTPQGRFIGAGLMLLGIAILGVTTATVASWFIDNAEANEEAIENESEQIEALRAEILSLKATLANQIVKDAQAGK